jgi:hypothetical protein
MSPVSILESITSFILFGSSLYPIIYLGIYHQVRLIQFFSVPIFYLESITSFVLFSSSLSFIIYLGFLFESKLDFKGLGAISEEYLMNTSSQLSILKTWYTMMIQAPGATEHLVQVVATKIEVTRSDRMEAMPTILAFTDIWVCCNCGAENLEVNAPDSCPLCGHYRGGCC